MLSKRPMQYLLIRYAVLYLWYKLSR